MARDQPVTDAEIEDAREAITEQREGLEDVGDGEPGQDWILSYTSE